MTADLPASIKGRLLNQAKARGDEFERTLVRFAAERLLYRLGACSARNRCILKGAALLAVWLPDPYRATRDLDFLASGASDEAAIRSLFDEICSVPCPEDGLRFDLAEMVIEAIRAEKEYSGQRVRFRAYLGNSRIAMQIDIGFGDALSQPPEEIEYPTLLKTLPEPRLLGYPREVSVAEKFQAMIELDTQNSRMKDFHDLWALAGAFRFEGPSLQLAIASCFARRRMPWTSETPRPLSAAFYEIPEIATRWRNYLNAGAVLVPPPTQFEVIGERIRQFLGPLREAILEGTDFEFRWAPGGPWKSVGNHGPEAWASEVALGESVS